ncbi:MAG: hypothetical protein LBT20_07730 [Clostridiales bacterium]|jgi:hypothetical protein|nr:hypothetical protein [Clostridiales bacterium]
MASDKMVESILKDYKKNRLSDGLKKETEFLVGCIISDKSDGGAVIRSLYLDGRSFRETARKMYLSRGAVEYNKKKAIREYAKRLEEKFYRSC